MRYILILLAFLLISGTVIYQGVRHDNTLTGSGITGDELKVDTSRLATKYYTGTLMSASGSTVRTISPAQITSDQDNYSPTGIGNANHVRISGDSDLQAITGITDSTAGVLEKTLINVGSYLIYLPMEHPDSDAAHRFTGYSGDFYLAAGQGVEIYYDITSSRWRIIGKIDNGLMNGLFFKYTAGTVTTAETSNFTFSISSGSWTATAGTTTLPYSAQGATGTSTSGSATLIIDKGSAYTSFAGSHIYTEATISIPTLSDGAQTYTVQLAISATLNSSVTNSNTVAIRYSHGVNSGKFELYARDNSGVEGTPADLGITVATNTLYKIRIELDKAKTEARAYINGAYAGRVTTGLPNSVACGSVMTIRKSAGSTARQLNVHNFSAGAIYQ